MQSLINNIFSKTKPYENNFKKMVGTYITGYPADNS